MLTKIVKRSGWLIVCLLMAVPPLWDQTAVEAWISVILILLGFGAWATGNVRITWQTVPIFGLFAYIYISLITAAKSLVGDWYLGLVVPLTVLAFLGWPLGDRELLGVGRGLAWLIGSPSPRFDLPRHGSFISMLLGELLAVFHFLASFFFIGLLFYLIQFEW